ncbi:MAG: hypothetical protein K2H01_02625 [Ruminococcus sp.]|nr:hypothetical protein [Ruminococcus sp.]
MPIESERLEEYLDDIGCPLKEKTEILDYAENHDIQNIIRLLRRHRQSTLDTIHKEEKQISCLDYLVFQLEKEMNTQ